MGEMSNENSSYSVLSDDFNESVKIVREIEDTISGTKSKEFQDKVKNMIEKVEKLTISVSRLDMFAENESLEEISTNYLRFLLLPALLASLNEKLSEGNRKEHLEICEIYIKDFIFRLKNYGILKPTFYFQCQDDQISSTSRTENEGNQLKSTAAEFHMTPESIQEAIKTRDQKIKRYQEQKDLQEKYDQMLKSVNFKNSDDERLREVFLVELQAWASKLSELYDNIQREKPILDHIAAIESGKIKPEPPQPRKPAQIPFIIARSKLQKEALGLGYPSIPTMSLEEFFDEKSKEGQIQVLDSKGKKPMTEEEEKIAKETARETDDQDLINSERDYDEYKDDHRRGWGSTHNKG